MQVIKSKKGKCFLSIFMVIIMLIGSLSMDIFSLHAKAAVGDTGVTKVRVLFDSITIDELGQTGRFWHITVDDIAAFCLDFGARASTGVSYNCEEYCTDLAINKACENFFNGQMNDETYIMTQGYIWAVLYGKDPFNTIAQIETSLHGSFSGEYIRYYISAIESANPTKEYGIFHSSREGDQRLLSNRENDPKVAQPEYSTVSASATQSSKSVVNISIQKNDEKTGKGLENVEFDFYADSKKIGSAKTDSNGIATVKYEEGVLSTVRSPEYRYCSNYDELNSYNKGIAANSVTYLSYNDAYNAAYIKAQELAQKDADNKAGMISHTYKAVETKARENYYYIMGQNSWSKQYAGSGNIYLKASNSFKSGEITIRKTDKENIAAQGDALISGAEYGLFAKEDIVHPDGKTGVLYRKDSYINSFPKTDSNGISKLENLYPGEYYVKELVAPEGYNIDDLSYDISLKSNSQADNLIAATVNVSDVVIKGQIKIIKHMQYVDYESQLVPQKPEESAEFEIIHKATGKVTDTLVTDSAGVAVSKKLPYGKYIVRQIKGADGCDFVNDFEVDITENNKEYSYVLENPIFHSIVKLVKKDYETKQNIQLSGVSFKLFDEAGNQISMWQNYPSREKIEVFKTSKDGTLLLPQALPYGKYTIEEVEAPYGYVKGEPVSFEVCRENSVKEDGINIVVVQYENMPVKGKIKIVKEGSVLKDYDPLTGKFVYDNVKLSDTVFRIKAATDILSTDGKIKYYSKGELVDEIITDDKGEGISKRLPLGEYYVEEVSAPDGFFINKEAKFVKLSYEDDSTEVVFNKINVINYSSKLRLSIIKTDAESKQALEGAEFSLYANKNIMSYDNKVIAKKGTLLKKAVSMKDGRAVFDIDLPYYDEELYYFVESKMPEGYANPGKNMIVEVESNNLDKEIIELEYNISNRKIKTKSVNLINEKEEPVTDNSTPVQDVGYVDTGDNTNIIMWITIMFIQFIIIYALNSYKKRARR